MRGKFIILGITWLACVQTALATVQLISNGGFQSGTAAPWVVEPSGSGWVVGNGYLSMGNQNGQTQYAYQTFTFPTNLIGATLSFDYWVASSNPYGDDTLTAELADIGLNPLIDFGTIYSADVTTNYIYTATNFIAYAGSNLLSSYAGQTLALDFVVQTDSADGHLTSFYITDVSMVAGTTADIPANDDFTNASLIPSPGITNDVTTTYASRETGEPDIADNKGGHSLWWTWTSPGIGTVTINTAGSDFNTLLGVYTGSSLTNLTVVTNSDGYKLGSGVAEVKFNVSPGAQYQISLDGYNGQSGSAVLAFKFAGDTTPPTVAITSPPAGADVTSSNVLVQGTASDNFGVAAVYYQLENANGSNAWQLATGTNSWSAEVTSLIPGTNTVRVEAIDTSTNVSAIVSRVFNYILSVPLTLTKIGEGTISGATNGQLIHLGYLYRLTATAASGFKFIGWTGDFSTNTATLSFTAKTNLRVSLTANFVDVEKPTLSITAPVARQRWSNSVFTVTGKAKDNVGVAAVWYQLNSGAWTTNVNTSDELTNWNVSVSLAPGTNTIKAYAEDAAGNVSLTNSVSFVYVLSAPFLVQINGEGRISPNDTNVVLQISNSYTLTATAGKGYVFSNWVSSTGAETNGPVLKFTMVSNLSYTVNFITNPFTPAMGTYQGLFYNTNSDGVAQASSGFFSAEVSDSGSFTAKFLQGSASYTVSGQFSLTGGWATNSLKSWENTTISLQLNLTNGDNLEGVLTNSAWTTAVELEASRAVFSSTNHAPQAGHKYTLVLPGTNTITQPNGFGFGSVTVSTSGSVAFSGTLGDGAKVTSSAMESAQGQWPFYISLYSGKGVVLGWLSFVDETNRDIDGELYWFKSPTGTVYPAGFAYELEAEGSVYSYTNGVPVLDLTNGLVSLTDGGLTPGITNAFTLGANNIVTGSNKLHLTLATSTGLFQGTTTNALGKTISFSGAVLQKQTNGFGLFLDGAQSGSASITPQ